MVPPLWQPFHALFLGVSWSALASRALNAEIDVRDELRFMGEYLGEVDADAEAVFSQYASKPTTGTN